MTITSSSDIADIRATAAAPVLPSANDITAWTSIALPSAIAVY
jgi:hypothetical protein